MSSTLFKNICEILGFNKKFYKIRIIIKRFIVFKIIDLILKLFY